MKKIGIIMGSDSDLPVIKKATDMLKALEIPFEVLRSKNEDTYSFEKATMQPLNNGLLRLAIDCHSAPRASWELSAFNTPFLVNLASGANPGSQTFVLDIDPEEINGNYGLFLL